MCHSQTQIVLPRELVDGLSQVLKCKPRDDRQHGPLDCKSREKKNDSIADREQLTVSFIF